MTVFQAAVGLGSQVLGMTGFEKSTVQLAALSHLKQGGQVIVTAEKLQWQPGTSFADIGEQ